VTKAGPSARLVPLNGTTSRQLQASRCASEQVRRFRGIKKQQIKNKGDGFLVGIQADEKAIRSVRR
jgi:hypothetical protein